MRSMRRRPRPGGAREPAAKRSRPVLGLFTSIGVKKPRARAHSAPHPRRVRTNDAMKACDRLTQRLLDRGPWVRQPAPYRLLEVRGPDAVDFLQRLCSQDVQALPAGALAPAAFLDAKGKVAATCLVGRSAAGLLLE